MLRLRQARTQPSNEPEGMVAPRQEPRPQASLLNSENIPAWYLQEDHRRTGFRPVTYSVSFCFHSLAYLHNETVNVYSHLIPAVLALLANFFLANYLALHFPLASTTDRLIFHLNLMTAVVCFGTSSAYHTLLCHSPYFNDVCCRLDYVAILFQILGSFISGIYVGFYCEPVLQKVYWSMISTLVFLTAVIVVHPQLQGVEWRSLRLFTFIATGLSAFTPILHAVAIDQQAGLRYYYLEGVLTLLGVAFFASHFPESWKPGRFDIWGASHQIFHILVVSGSVVHMYGVLTAFKWNYDNPRC